MQRLKFALVDAEKKVADQARTANNWKSYYDGDEAILSRLCAILGVKDGSRKDEIETRIRILQGENANLQGQVQIFREFRERLNPFVREDPVNGLH